MSNAREQKLDLTIGFGRLIVTSPNINVELTDDGRVVVHKGTVEQTNISAKHEFAKPLKTGDVIADGPNKGWIYCEDNELKPFLVAPRDSGFLKWRDAMEFVARGQADLPTLEQLVAMFDAREAGALKGTFNAISTDLRRWYWSSTESYSTVAWALCFNNGLADSKSKGFSSSVRYVRPYTPA